MKNKDIFTPLEKYVLPFGFLMIFVLYLISDDKNEMQTVFYLLVLLPGLILLPKNHSLITKNLYFIPIILFLIFSTLSVLWNKQADIDDFITISKNSVYIVIFFLVVGILSKTEILVPILKILSLLSACLIIYSILKNNYFNSFTMWRRLGGSGNLINPLLSATTYGVFAIFIVTGLTRGFFKTKSESLFFIIVLIILLTGIIFSWSRMPIASILVVTSLILFNKFPKYGLWFCFLSLILLVILVFIHPDILKYITARGSSGRPELWSQTFDLIKESPWYGHGVYSELKIYYLNTVFNSAHNRFLATLYYTGIIGGGLLILSLATAFWPSKKESSNLEIFAKYVLLFAILCSLTQGKYVITRPDLLWLIIWFPAAILIMGKYYYRAYSETETIEQ